MIKSKKVSVIIPFYSRIDWLYEALESAINQTYKNIEIIVVNDGSKEDMTLFLERYKDKIIYKYQRNQGVAIARNEAMRIATGDYFAFLDSDDIWLPEKLEKQIAYMEQTGVVWSHTGYYFWYPSSGKLKRITNNNDRGDIYIKSFISIRIATPSVIVKAQVVRENPFLKFPEEYRKGQDTVFYQRLSKLYPLGLLNKPLVKVRIRGDNSNTLALARFSMKAKVYNEVIKSDKSFPFFIRLIYKIYNFYSRVFDDKGCALEEFIAKVFWTIPYSLERIYLKKIESHKII